MLWYFRDIYTGLQTVDAPAPKADECAICQESWTSRPRVITSCGHDFHEDCIRQWVTTGIGSTTACPCCRARLFDDMDEEDDDTHWEDNSDDEESESLDSLDDPVFEELRIALNEQIRVYDTAGPGLASTEIQQPAENGTEIACGDDAKNSVNATSEEHPET